MGLVDIVWLVISGQIPTPVKSINKQNHCQLEGLEGQNRHPFGRRRHPRPYSLSTNDCSGGELIKVTKMNDEQQ